jgi:hypothetical protein
VLSCDRCGRVADRADQRYCGDCGERLVPTSTTGGAAASERPRDRIGAIYRHADWSLLREHTPSSSGPATGQGVLVAIGLVFTVGLSGLAFLAWQRFDAPEPWQWGVVALPAGMSVLALAWALRSIARLLGFLSAELDRRPVLVVDERRVETSGRAGSGARPSYFVTLEDEGGRRFEMPCTPRVASLVRPDDLAVAYVRGNVLLDLVRVDAG